MKFFRLMAVAAFGGLLLTGCVTETIDPVFNVQKSDEEALKDYLQLSVGYLEQGDLANAKRHLENAAKIDGNNSDVYGIWGLIYTREGEFDLADENFRRSLRIDGDNSKVRNNYAAFLFAQGRIDEAYDHLERVVRDTEYEARPQAFENLGLAALRLDRNEEAERAFSRALQLNPNQLRSTLELTDINLARKDFPQARAYFRSYQTLLQFYNRRYNARSLWIGAQLELAQGNREGAKLYGDQLKTNFADSHEYELFQQAAR